MKIIVIIFSILILLIFSVLIYLYSLFISKDKPKLKSTQDEYLKTKYKLTWKAYALIYVAIFFIIISFFAPLIFTTQTEIKDFNFIATGQIGDTIGGLMNPFIALGGVLITGLAFYVQYKANELQRELFLLQIDYQNHQSELQKIESQFYEMLKLHRENITEMKINGYDFEEVKLNSGEYEPLKRIEKVTEGRKIFVTMKTELEFILLLYKRHFPLDKTGFQKCYKIFFSGLDEYDRKYPEDKEFTNHLRVARVRHENPAKSIFTNVDRKSYSNLKLNFNYKPFSGHASRLGHYFRHLYLAVKSIANNEVVTGYEEKMKYLRLLRAQLSNHEQILLFYNWLGGYGNDWENEKHQFFTEYCMIHNLLWDNLIEDDYIKNQVNSLRVKEVNLRKGSMFEID